MPLEPSDETGSGYYRQGRGEYMVSTCVGHRTESPDTSETGAVITSERKVLRCPIQMTHVYEPGEGVARLLASRPFEVSEVDN